MEQTISVSQSELCCFLALTTANSSLCTVRFEKQQKKCSWGDKEWSPFKVFRQQGLHIKDGKRSSGEKVGEFYWYGQSQVIITHVAMFVNFHGGCNYFFAHKVIVTLIVVVDPDLSCREYGD